MQIETRGQLIKKTIPSNILNINNNNQNQEVEMIENKQVEVKWFSSEEVQQAVDSINEFFEVTHSELKFVFHEGLEKYFVQLVNSDTEEVVKEIPSKKLLDVFYEMQKLIGIIVDEKI